MGALTKPKHVPAHARVEDFFAVQEEPTPEVREDLDKYFEVFAAPVLVEGDQVCIGCGEKFGGLMANLGFGVAIEWGLVHGEGHCNKCHWPYRGYHYIRDRNGESLANITNLFLAYHPDHVKRN